MLVKGVRTRVVHANVAGKQSVNQFRPSKTLRTRGRVRGAHEEPGVRCAPRAPFDPVKVAVMMLPRRMGSSVDRAQIRVRRSLSYLYIMQIDPLL